MKATNGQEMIAACEIVVDTLKKNKIEHPERAEEVKAGIHQKAKELLHLVPYVGKEELTEEQQQERAAYKIAMMMIGNLAFGYNRAFSPSLIAAIASVMDGDDEEEE